MIRIGTLAIIALALSACGFDKPPQGATNGQASKPVPGVESQEPGVQEPLATIDHLEVFAAQLVEKGPGAFRFDRIRDAREGGQERQVFVEMLGADDQAAADISADILESAGFVPGHSFGDENGIRLSYTYNGGEPVRVLVRTREAHSKLANVEATSSVYLTQPVTNP
ncbi:hypothetical protein WCE55_11290 [Luteimonas sp. MJ293]|uniref:hypothetical protein n=1 Tax=Luteimonas sp. MJ146 TaxID=3129240 RepID=UPI0031BB25E3